MDAPEGPWSSGLFGCFEDIPNCCVTCWCPCITFGKVSHIVDQGTTSCGANGAIYAALMCFTGCACLFSCLTRTKMRNIMRLQESPCGDCCVHFFCEQCALCQEYRELKNRDFDMSIGWEENLERQKRAPMSQGGMTR